MGTEKARTVPKNGSKEEGSGVPSGASVLNEVAAEGDVATSDDETAGVAQSATPIESKKVLPWSEFVRTASDFEITRRFADDIAGMLREEGLSNHCCLALLEPDNSIDTIDLDRIFRALCKNNAKHNKDVVLFLLSRGGSIEPAYQISKLCKSFAKKKFIAVVPRFAKSAATLIAIGADEIHIGPLGQLGPIDPQLGGLPALGVSQALQRIASVAQAYPGSAEMFAHYLRLALTVEQIGYCDRIAESAVQYAERLLLTKASLNAKAPTIARELVHEYKDHGFVIDLAEAQQHLGSDWVKTDTKELRAAERIYSHFNYVNLILPVGKAIIVLGAADDPAGMMLLQKRSGR